MSKSPERLEWRKMMQRGLVEVAGIIFLFYSNLLMGEFNRSNGQGKTLLFALQDIFTAKNFAIGLSTAMFGFATFEALRRKL